MSDWRFSLLWDLLYALKSALPPSAADVCRSPAILLRPNALSRLFMAHVWRFFGNPTDEGGRPAKRALITPNASGVVLDIGAGHGHTVHYLDLTKVTKYIALEPNARMHAEIRKVAHGAGLSESAGTFQILPYGAEDLAAITHALGGTRSVGTVVSVLTLCSLPDAGRLSPRAVLQSLIDGVLKPGGQLLFYEHVLSPRPEVASWQRFWTPVWRRFFDGCCLDRPTHVWIEDFGSQVWSEGKSWGKEGEPEQHLFWHQAGRFVKR